MSMFCFQCQETARGTGCEIQGVCGKKEDTAKLLDLLLFTAKSVALYSSTLRSNQLTDDMDDVNTFLYHALFVTITNANFDNEEIYSEIKRGIKIRNMLKEMLTTKNIEVEAKYRNSDYVTFEPSTMEADIKFAESKGVLRTEDEDIRSLREMIMYGLKGMSAYGLHAHNIGYANEEITKFLERALLGIDNDELKVDDLLALTLETGKFGVEAMALLDKANSETYGTPEITEVNIGVGKNPGILITGHDLKDIKELLEQTKDSGVDIYTHSEMLPAHYYPELKKYSHLVANYGGAWFTQAPEFEKFNGPIVFTSNCIVPPKKDANYNDRVFTLNAAGYPGWKKLKEVNGKVDYSEVIELAKRCSAPEALEEGKVIGGFAHGQVFKLADKIVEAVKSGAIKKFIVMGGCDGRMKSREYYTDFANNLPKDTVILTSGCAKYRYNKLNLGDIGGIPRVLDAGQCNDSYSWAVVAMKLQEIFEAEDINDLPIFFNIAWYEQKAVIVLLALLYLGVKNIHLGPTLPGFLSPNVANVLIEKFGIGLIGTVDEDIKKFIVS